MVEMAIEYNGDMRCTLRHGPSGREITTDAPRDNHGKGEAFSPTDLVGAALGSCILTTMAIVAKRDGIDFSSAQATVVKEMVLNPRRIGALKLKIMLPKNLTEEQRHKMEIIAKTCPVHKSLHPDVQLPMEFIYK